MQHTQRYTSSELFHFVGREDLDDDARYLRLVTIVKSDVLKPYISEGPSPAFVMNCNRKFSENEMFNPSMVCFRDIPVEGLGIHMQKYSYFGLSFSIAYLVKKGANPVFYNALRSINMNGNRESYFNDQVGSYFKRWSDKVFTPGRCTTNKDELKQLKQLKEIKEIKDEFNFFLSSFFSYTVFFDHEKKETDSNNYYMERE